MDSQNLENNEYSGEGRLRRSLFSTRWFRALGASALLVGFAAGGYGIASATTNSRGSSIAGATRTGPGSGYQKGHRPSRHTPPAAIGTVASVGTNASGVNYFTVKTHAGTTVTVDVTSTTTYKDQSVTSPSFANVTTGETVVVEGTTASGTVTATSVAIGFGFGRGMGGGFGQGTPPAAIGTVASVGTNASGVNYFTVKTHAGTTVTVDVTSTTTYKDQSVTSPSFANVTTGETVVVEGTTASGTVTATSVAIGFGRGGRNYGHGGGFNPGWND